MPRKTGKEFLWNDDKVELLLNITNEYKVKKAADGIDWESVKSKYSDILELLKDALPDDEETQKRLKRETFHQRISFTRKTKSRSKYLHQS